MNSVHEKAETTLVNLVTWPEGFKFIDRRLHVSQRMTFLYSPRLGNQSSRPVTKPTAMLSKAWRPCGMSNLDRAIAPTTGAGGYNFVSACMRGKAIRKDPIKGGILASSSQSALDSRVIHNPGPSWDFCPGLRLACSPLQR